MFMRYRGGGVGHSSTRDATNRFLLDRHPLDLSNDDGDIEDEGSERENAGGDDDNDDDDQSSEGSVQGDGTGGNQADDYGYERPAEEDNESEPEPDDADDALGPEDGEGEVDETYLLGFAAL